MARALKKKSKTELEDEAKLAELQARAAARMSRMTEVKSHAAPPAASLEEFDTRGRERIVAGSPAIVICEADDDMPATIVDMSDDGLRLRFAKPNYLAETIVIDSPAFEGFIVAEVKWQTGNEAGVAFDHAWTRRLAEPIKSGTARRI